MPKRKQLKVAKRALVPRNKYAIAQIDNTFSNFVFPNFRHAGHQYGEALLYAIISAANQSGSATFDLQAEEMKKVVLWQQTKHLSFSQALKQVVQDTNNGILIEKQRDWACVPIFLQIGYSHKKQQVHVELNPIILKYFTNLLKNYTKTLPHDYAVLRYNSPAKALYTILRQYRGLGNTRIFNLNEIITRFSLSKTYLDNPYLIKKRVMTRAINALEKNNIFQEIKVHVINGKHNNKIGRPKISGYYFTFQRQDPANEVGKKVDSAKSATNHIQPQAASYLTVLTNETKVPAYKVVDDDLQF